MPVLRRGESDTSFRYRIQRSERPYNRSLFLGLFLIAVCLVIISIDVRTEYGNSLASYLVMPLDFAYKGAKDRTTATTDAVARHWDTARRLAEAEAANLALRQDLARLNLEVTQYRAMAASWPLHQYFSDEKTLPAAVIRINDDPLRHTLVLDRGRVHGVARYMPAVVPGASGEPVLVGRIVELRPYASLLLLIDDPQSAVAAQVGDVPGMLMGTGQGCVLKVSKDTTLHVGDRVTTSGRGIYYPPDLYLGRISNRHAEQVSLDQVYPIELPFRLQDLRLVLVLPNLYRDDALQLEATQ